MLNDLKSKIMSLAREKGWGASPDEINVHEKIAFIASELAEASEEYAKAADVYLIFRRQLVEAGYIYWASNVMMCESQFQPVGEKTERFVIAYRKEWGDVLQRTLHLGGIFGVDFPECMDDVMIDGYRRSKRDSEFIRVLFRAHAHYRHNRLTEFRLGLVEVAHYCMAVSIQDSFDIAQLVLEKIEENRNRSWDGLNETRVN
ncbi:hypothetical protein ACFLZN_00420 [Nanoarchaeota archaeon]